MHLLESEEHDDVPGSQPRKLQQQHAPLINNANTRLQLCIAWILVLLTVTNSKNASAETGCKGASVKFMPFKQKYIFRSYVRTKAGARNAASRGGRQRERDTRWGGSRCRRPPCRRSSESFRSNPGRPCTAPLHHLCHPTPRRKSTLLTLQDGICAAPSWINTLTPF